MIAEARQRRLAELPRCESPQCGEELRIEAAFVALHPAEITARAPETESTDSFLATSSNFVAPRAISARSRRALASAAAVSAASGTFGCATKLSQAVAGRLNASLWAA